MKAVVAVMFSAVLLPAAPAWAQSRSIAHSKDTINATGEGNSVGSRGRSAELAGATLRVGDKLPSVSLVKTDMTVVDLGSNGGKVRILNIVPSLDTTTCDAQTHELAETNEGLDSNVEMVTISMDLPFAQRRYTKESGFKNVTFLSDYRGQNFGKGTGLLLKQAQLLARAVLVVDRDNVIRYMQVMPDMSFLPDMQAAFKAARGLI